MRRLLTTLRSVASGPTRARLLHLPKAVACVALAALLWLGVLHRESVAHAQQPAVPNPQVSPRPPLFGGQEDANEPSMDRRQQEQLEKGRQEERQKQLIRDTDRLLELAQQLKDQVNKSNKNTLSLDVVKKAAEIEKLAKSVKDRMRG